jgi:cytidylate kinase
MKNKLVVTIGREYGSGGREIGEIVSRLLGLDFYDKELIELAAQKSGLNKELFENADEKKSFSLQGGVFGLRSSLIDDVNAGYFLSNESLFTIQSEVIRDVAQSGSALFVGRCADYVLKEMECLFSVFIVADNEEAAALIDKTDKKRASYYNYFSNKRWGEPHSYDLCVNSSTFGIEGTAKMIADSVLFRKC